MTNTRVLLVLPIMLIFLFAGCLGPIPRTFKILLPFDMQEIAKQETIISADMNYSEKLLDFQEQGSLASFVPTYQAYSNAIGAACDKIDTIDSDKTSRTKWTKDVCDNKKSLDKCFLQLEKIRGQVKDSETNINLDSLDVLCSDLQTIGLQNKLDDFKTQYTNYMTWLNAEKTVNTDWNKLVILFNTSSGPQLTGASLSEYYKDYKTQMADAKKLLDDIKENCASKGEYKFTDNKLEKVCNNVGGYLSDLDTANAVVLDTFNFFGKFESGTVTIDSAFVKDCNAVSKEYSAIYNLKLITDTKTEGTNMTDLSSMCKNFEDLSNTYASLGIPLILVNGQLSSTTKTELFKAKTVYVETENDLGSGVIIGSDSSGYYILTNGHVALITDPNTGQKYLSQYVRVKFYDGKIGYASELAYTMEGYDMVILYVPSSGSYPTASYDETTYPNVGDSVVAVGNPYGLEFSVTKGTVSGIRNMGCLTDYCYGTVIQTDTAINPGNSGGGLWNYDTGYLLGINSLGLTQAEGLNFAISMYQYGQIKDTFKWYKIQ